MKPIDDEQSGKGDLIGTPAELRDNSVLSYICSVVGPDHPHTNQRTSLPDRMSDSEVPGHLPRGRACQACRLVRSLASIMNAGR